MQQADEPQANSLGDAIQSGAEFLVGRRMGFGMQAEVGGHSGDYGCKADRERQALKRALQTYMPRKLTLERFQLLKL